MAALVIPPRSARTISPVPVRRPARSAARPTARRHQGSGGIAEVVVLRPVLSPAPGALAARTPRAVFVRRRLVALVLAVATVWLGAGVVVPLVGELVQAWAGTGSAEVLTTEGEVAGPSAVASAGSDAAAMVQPGPASGGRYVVRPGDTLWSIASRLRPDRDPREIVELLEERTHGAVIHPGQRIDISDLP